MQPLPPKPIASPAPPAFKETPTQRIEFIRACLADEFKRAREHARTIDEDTLRIQALAESKAFSRAIDLIDSEFPNIKRTFV